MLWSGRPDPAPEEARRTRACAAAGPGEPKERARPSRGLAQVPPPVPTLFPPRGSYLPAPSRVCPGPSSLPRGAGAARLCRSWPRTERRGGSESEARHSHVHAEPGAPERSSGGAARWLVQLGGFRSPPWPWPVPRAQGSRPAGSELSQTPPSLEPSLPPRSVPSSGGWVEAAAAQSAGARCSPRGRQPAAARRFPVRLQPLTEAHLKGGGCLPE